MSELAVNGRLFPVGTHMPFERRLGNTGGAYSYRDDVLVVGGTDHLDSIVIHELAHFFEHCSTPLGLAKDELNAYEMRCTRQALETYQGTVFLPVYEWAKRYRMGGASPIEATPESEMEMLIERYIHPWSASAFLANVLDGIKDGQVDQSYHLDAIEALRAIEPRLSEMVGLNVHGAAQELPLCINTESEGPDNPPYPACPSVVWRTGRTTEVLPIGSWHISEAIAQIIEDYERLDPERAPPEYSILLGACIGQLGSQAAAEPSIGRKGLFATCLSLCDLALFTPIGAHYRRLRSPTMTWQDLHPGYRFLTALKLVGQEGLWIADIDEAEELGEFLCECLGWVKPRRFLELGAGFVWQMRHRDACQIRLGDFSAPYRFSYLKAPATGGVQSFFEAYMPIVEYPGWGSVCPVPDTDTENRTATERARDCLFARLAWLVMRGGDMPLLPPSFRYDLYFENVRCEEEFVACFRSAHPWSSSSRMRILAE